MKTEIAVITAMINGRKKFVMVGEQLPNGKLKMEYTDIPERATDYEDEDAAEYDVPLLHNPLDRELNTDTVIVEMQPIVPRLSGSFK